MLERDYSLRPTTRKVTTSKYLRVTIPTVFSLWAPVLCTVGLAFGSDGGGSTQFGLDVPEGDEKWRHAVVAGVPPGNALWILTPGRPIDLLDVGADTLRAVSTCMGRSLASEVGGRGLRCRSRRAFVVLSVRTSWRKRFSWPQHRQCTLTLARVSPSLNVERISRRRFRVLRVTI